MLIFKLCIIMLSCNWIFISRIKSTALCPRSIADAFCQRVRVRQWVMQLLNLNKYSLAWRWRIGRTRTVWHDVQSVQFHKSTSKIGFQMLRLLAWHGRYLQPNFSWWHKFMRLDVRVCHCFLRLKKSGVTLYYDVNSFWNIIYVCVLLM